MANVLAEIRVEDLSNTGAQRYRLQNLLGNNSIEGNVIHNLCLVVFVQSLGFLT
jgi:hypothetical protein